MGKRGSSKVHKGLGEKEFWNKWKDTMNSGQVKGDNKVEVLHELLKDMGQAPVFSVRNDDEVVACAVQAILTMRRAYESVITAMTSMNE